MTVKEAIKVLRSAKEVKLCWGGLALPLDRGNELQMDAFGNYEVAEIAAAGPEPDVYEITLAMRPIKVGE